MNSNLKTLLLFGVFCYFNNAKANDSSLICKGKTETNGNKDGVWICKKNGRLNKKEVYKNGILTTYTLYNNKGEIIERKKKNGKIKHYKPCGCY